MPSGTIYILIMPQNMLITVCLIQWSPDKASVFGSSAEDGLLNIWDYEKVQFQNWIVFTILPCFFATTIIIYCEVSISSAFVVTRLVKR
jgi:WD40 repeat protein